MAMLPRGRTLVVALALALVGVGCGGRGDARPKTGPAGKVIEVSGAVVAQRGGEAGQVSLSG